MKIPFFLHPYIISHVISFLSYLFVRKLYLNMRELKQYIGFGLTRESMIVLLFVAILVFKANSYWTPEHFFVQFVWYFRILVSMLIYFGGSYKILFVYWTTWFALWILIDVPKYIGKSEIIELNSIEFEALINQTNENKQKDRYIFCVFYSEMSQESLLVFLKDRKNLVGVFKEILLRRFFILQMFDKK